MKSPKKRQAPTKGNNALKAPGGRSPDKKRPRTPQMSPQPQNGSLRPINRPYGNTNALRHGLRSSKLPNSLKWVERRTNEFRQFIEQALIDSKSEITLVDAATINTAIRWERHAILAGHYLNKELDNLTPDQRLKYSEAIAKASDRRDWHLRLLGIDSNKSPWDQAFNGDIKE
jgi:hypothetical protein